MILHFSLHCEFEVIWIKFINKDAAINDFFLSEKRIDYNNC